MSLQYGAKLEMRPGIHREPGRASVIARPIELEEFGLARTLALPGKLSPHLFRYRRRDLMGPFLQRCAVTTLDEQARFGFGARVAQ
jgi:hypothetical protein